MPHLRGGWRSPFEGMPMFLGRVVAAFLLDFTTFTDFDGCHSFSAPAC